MIKTVIIACYIGHKIYWKATHKERRIQWVKFFESAK